VVRLRTKVSIEGTKVKPALRVLIRESARVGASTTKGSALGSVIRTIELPIAPILPRTNYIEAKDAKVSTIIIGLCTLRAL
jgi:hypothetical protein